MLRDQEAVLIDVNLFYGNNCHQFAIVKHWMELRRREDERSDMWRTSRFQYSRDLIAAGSIVLVSMQLQQAREHQHQDQGCMPLMEPVGLAHQLGCALYQLRSRSVSAMARIGRHCSRSHAGGSAEIQKPWTVWIAFSSFRADDLKFFLRPLMIAHIN